MGVDNHGIRGVANLSRLFPVETSCPIPIFCNFDIFFEGVLNEKIPSDHTGNRGKGICPKTEFSGAYFQRIRERSVYISLHEKVTVLTGNMSGKSRNVFSSSIYLQVQLLQPAVIERKGIPVQESQVFPSAHIRPEVPCFPVTELCGRDLFDFYTRIFQPSDDFEGGIGGTGIYHYDLERIRNPLHQDLTEAAPDMAGFIAYRDDNGYDGIFRLIHRQTSPFSTAIGAVCSRAGFAALRGSSGIVPSPE
jgi:hypothetical protein